MKRQNNAEQKQKPSWNELRCYVCTSCYFWIITSASYKTDSNISNVTFKYNDIKDYTKFQSIKYNLYKSATFLKTSYPYNQWSLLCSISNYAQIL